MAGGAIEVRESIEAKGNKDEDVVMGDATDPKEQKDAHADADADADADAEGDVDAEGEPDDDADADGEADPDAEGEPDDEDNNAQQRRDQRALLNLIDETQAYLSNYKEEGDDEELARGFQRLPNKRFLPDYFDVIKTPVAFSTVRAKILKKGYTNFSEFVRDVAQIFHNAQVYNRPSAGVYGAAIRLRILFQDKLQDLIKKGLIKPEEAELPDLGEIPEVEDSPPPEDEEEEEEEDEEDDEEDSDDEGARRRGRRRGRRPKKDIDDDDDAEAPVKKRGRPPKVFTPLEGRIYAILKGLRRFKNEHGELRVLPFERLPDKALEKDYYTVIKNPIALDGIKRNYKRKKYNSVDQVLADLDLLFENAKAYNEEGSDVYEDAVELQKQAHLLADQEKAKPDDAFRDEDGKLPLASIEYKGELWRVGDWVHINNPNDPRKPIVAQIYRTWQDREGHKWVNACWYYRPEQTVHHYEKHFFEHEVVKTGQYRDHRIEEIDDRCFVMFITRYPKGRPRGFPRDKSVYVCESRYNEEKSTFNKIKTWASCLPDEVREKDYEMDLYPVPIRMKKVPSPIKHLLQVDAKETDDLPKPTWSNSNAPPMIGAVHRRPREANESPPPEPTPPPMMAPLAPQMPMDQTRRQSFNSRPDIAMTGTYQPTDALPGPSPSPVPHYPHQFQPTHGSRPIATPTPPILGQQFPLPPMMPGPAAAPPPVAQAPHYSPHPGYSQHQQFTPGPVPTPQHMPSPVPIPAYNQPPPPRHAPPPAMMGTPSRTPMAPAPNVNTLPHANAQSYSNQYNVPRTHEVYRLMDPQVEASIPESIRDQFQRDDEGRLLWFTAAGRDRSALDGVAPEYAGLGHSISHLAHIADVREERRRKRKERDEKIAAEEEAKRRSTGAEKRDEEQRRSEEAREAAQRALLEWASEIEKGTKVIEEGLGDWRDEKKVWDEERRAVKATGTSTE